MSKCQMPKCPNADKDVPTVTVNIADEMPVLRECCADCLQPE